MTGLRPTERMALEIAGMAEEIQFSRSPAVRPVYLSADLTRLHRGRRGSPERVVGYYSPGTFCEAKFREDVLCLVEQLRAPSRKRAG